MLGLEELWRRRDGNLFNVLRDRGRQSGITRELVLGSSSPSAYRLCLNLVDPLEEPKLASTGDTEFCRVSFKSLPNQPPRAIFDATRIRAELIDRFDRRFRAPSRFQKHFKGDRLRH